MSIFKDFFGNEFGEAANVERQYPDSPVTEIPFTTPNNSEDACTFSNTHAGARVGLLPLIQIIEAGTGEVLGGNHWRVSCFVSDEPTDPVTNLSAGTGNWKDVAGRKNRIWLKPNTDYILRLQPRQLDNGAYVPVPSIGGTFTVVHTGRDGNEEFYAATERSNEVLNKLDTIISILTTDSKTNVVGGGTGND
jgi:hypothetical protein